MALVCMSALILPGASALLLNVPLRTQCARSLPVMTRMSEEGPRPMNFEEYVKERDAGTVQGGTMEKSDADMKEFEKYDLDFDGGDSGGGVVGDGNTDLEDQHNSPSIVRGGFGAAAVGEDGGVNVGRGSVKSAVDARVASAGKNYFGRSTGYAQKKISEITDADRKNNKMDEVRAQQLENWHNQRAVAKSNRAQGQGVVFGEDKSVRTGPYLAREALSSSAWRNGAQEGVELSQRDLAKHLDKLRNEKADRLDGEEWAEITAGNQKITEQFEIKAAAGGVVMLEIPVQNQFNTFAPYQCAFTADSPAEFTATPNEGSMNRRSGDPIDVTVRFNPTAYGQPLVGTLVFETEDFKNVYQIIGST